MKRTFAVIGLAASLALATIAMASTGATSDPAAKSLYERLGGKTAITGVVNEFVGNVAGDGRINNFFKKTAGDPKRLAAFKANLVNQICQASGGPCTYKGLDMKAAHRGMGISDADFGALVEDLVKALDKFNVGATEKNELLAALGGMKGEIVGQ